MPEEGAIEVGFEDFIFRELLLEFEGEEGLGDLREEGASIRLQAAADQLLRDGGAAGNDAAGGDVLPHCPDDALEAHAGVAIEPTVLDGEDG